MARICGFVRTAATACSLLPTLMSAQVDEQLAEHFVLEEPIDGDMLQEAVRRCVAFCGVGLQLLACLPWHAWLLQLAARRQLPFHCFHSVHCLHSF